MSKILRSRDLRHAPFGGKLLMHPHSFPKTNLCTKHEVPRSNSLKTCWIACQHFYRSLDLGHTPLGKIIAPARLSQLPKRSYVPNLRSLAEVVLTICLIVCQKFEGSRDLGHAPFRENCSCATTDGTDDANYSCF